MADQAYTYHGPTSGVTLVVGEGEDRTEREVMLYTGAEVALPAENEHVQALVAQELLQVTPAPAPRRRASTPTADEAST